jgi:hypothetical protein
MVSTADGDEFETTIEGGEQARVLCRLPPHRNGIDAVFPDRRTEADPHVPADLDAPGPGNTQGHLRIGRGLRQPISDNSAGVLLESGHGSFDGNRHPTGTGDGSTAGRGSIDDHALMFGSMPPRFPEPEVPPPGSKVPTRLRVPGMTCGMTKGP